MLGRLAATLGASALLTAGLAPAALAQDAAPAANDTSVNLNEVQEATNNGSVPADVAEGLNQGIDAAKKAAPSDGSVPIPSKEEVPRNNKFLLPSISLKCIGGKSPSFGMTTTIPGPSQLPLPGVKEGQLAFIFTGLGTKGVSENQQTEMNVSWYNLSNGRAGKTKLTNELGINAENGPGTVAGIADTGNGLVAAAITGGFTSPEDGGDANCNYTANFGLFPVHP